MKLSRALAKKIVRLSLLGTSTLGLLVSSGVSFAKYYTENNFNDNAGAAKFNVTLTNNTKFIYLPDDLSSYSSSYYAFTAEFVVDFSECEVKTNFDLYLKLCGEYSTNYDNPYKLEKNQTYFTLSSNSVVYTIEGDVNDDEHTLIKDNVASSLTDGKCTSFTKDKLYYGYSNDGTTYNWAPTFSTTINRQEIIINNIPSNALSKHYFKVVYFTYIGITTSGYGSNLTYSASFENSIILSKLEIEQVV